MKVQEDATFKLRGQVQGVSMELMHLRMIAYWSQMFTFTEPSSQFLYQNLSLRLVELLDLLFYLSLQVP